MGHLLSMMLIEVNHQQNHLISPIGPISGITDEYTQPYSAAVHSDLQTNILYQPLALQDIFNTEIKKHIKFNLKCTENLKFDAFNLRNWGLCRSEGLICTKCSHITDFYKLYDEIKKEKRGRSQPKQMCVFRLA